MTINKDGDLVLTHKNRKYIYYHLLGEWCDGNLPLSTENKLNAMMPKIYRLLFESCI